MGCGLCAPRPAGTPLHDPFCYRDERTVASKQKADAILPPEEAFRRTGAQPLRINTIYQLLADDAHDRGRTMALSAGIRFALARRSARLLNIRTRRTPAWLISLQEIGRAIFCKTRSICRSCSAHRCRRALGWVASKGRCPSLLLFAARNLLLRLAMTRLLR